VKEKEEFNPAYIRRLLMQPRNGETKRVPSYMRRLLVQPPIADNLFPIGPCQGRAPRAAQRSSTLDTGKSGNIPSLVFFGSLPKQGFLSSSWDVAWRR
jgi:hypothetical protein